MLKNMQLKFKNVNFFEKKRKLFNCIVFRVTN